MSSQSRTAGACAVSTSGFLVPRLQFWPSSLGFPLQVFCSCSVRFADPDALSSPCCLGVREWLLDLSVYDNIKLHASLLVVRVFIGHLRLRDEETSEFSSCLE